MRLLIVQYGGDYRKAYQLVYKEGIETYHAQKYVLDTVLRITEKIDEVILLCCKTTEAYNVEITKGLRVIGAGVEPYQQINKIIEIIDAHKPTHLVVHFPMPEIISYCIQNKIKTIALLADSFLKTGLRRQWKNYQLARLLNNQQIDWIGNHGVNACLSLQKIGVKPKKIVPYDWTHSVTPELFTTKQLQPDAKSWKLVYVGLVVETKGIGDVLQAVAMLREKGFAVNLEIAGSGDEEFVNRAEKLGISGYVKFLGLVPNYLVLKLMREADIVVVPSWHEYPEACPFTIYEAFCVRTPIVASNHPMFQGNLKHKINAMIYPARNSEKLAECINQLLSQPELYTQISAASVTAWQNLQIPVKWADLIEKWLYNSPQGSEWLSNYSLASGAYNSDIRTSSV
jgi:glycosyltransferase involved in cell wall biosynthesis